MVRRGAKRNCAQVTSDEVAADAVNAMVMLDGDFTIYRVAELRQMLTAHVAAGARRFDLSGVTDFDSAGVQLLAATRGSVSRVGGQAEFFKAPRCVWEVCSTLGLQAWLSRGTEVT